MRQRRVICGILLSGIVLCAAGIAYHKVWTFAADSWFPYAAGLGLHIGILLVVIGVIAALASGDSHLRDILMILFLGSALTAFGVWGTWKTWVTHEYSGFVGFIPLPFVALLGGLVGLAFLVGAIVSLALGAAGRS
jgi:uncharacterized membrane protein (DUF441 family)